MKKKKKSKLNKHFIGNYGEDSDKGYIFEDIFLIP